MPANRVDSGVWVLIFDGGGANTIAAEIFHADLLVGTFFITHTNITFFILKKH